VGRGPVFRKRNGEEYFWGFTIAVRVVVPNGEWTLEVAPINGSKAIAKTVTTVLLSLLLFSLLGGSFAWYMARQPRLLKILVEKRAAELLQSENRFRTLRENYVGDRCGGSVRPDRE
jgi:hypothetical protein